MSTFLNEKKTRFGPIRSLFTNFHQQIIVISSQNNVRKYRTKEHEEVYELVPNNECFRIVYVLISSETVYSMTKHIPPQLQK